MNERIAAVLLLLVGGCDLPRDADHTLDRVQRGALWVGVIRNPPWVTDSGTSIRGVDVELVERMAADLGARVTWSGGTESELLTSLHGRELDLVIGGLSGNSPWKKQVAFTRPYYIDSTLVSPSHAPDLKGDSVAFRAGDPVAIYLRRKGAVPVPVADLASVQGPVAGPAWWFAAQSRASGGRTLHTDKRVMAVAPGENGWLNWVERWLSRHQSSVPALLGAGGK
jgi:polar amino acid transport system substrate-binding protein